MKKLFIISLLFLSAVSAVANPVDVNTAKKAANAFIQSKLDTKVELQLVNYADRSHFNNFYVFGTDNSFVIIAADDCVQPILGYSIENHFGMDEMPENLYYWLEGYDEQIAEAAKSGQKATQEVRDTWVSLVSGNIPKSKDTPTYLIQTNWNQGAPYNIYCPSCSAGDGGHACTGCVATAMAQIMKYYGHPAQGFGSHSYTPRAHPDYGEISVNFGQTIYDWSNMTNTYGNSSTDIQNEAVATLMYHCGVSLNMNYNGDNQGSSGAYTDEVAYALQNYFNYSQTIQYVSRSGYSDTTWKNLLIQEISANRPIQYHGAREENGKLFGHSFICDGYYESEDKFHFNWGWGGTSDGWFYITGNETPQIQYKFSQGAVIGIQPINYNEQPTDLVASVSGRTVALEWNGIEGASSYNVYRDYNLIGNTTSPSFTDTNIPLGTFLYFVRGVNSQGNVSLPSNITTATVRFEGSLSELNIEHLKASHENGNVRLQWAAPYQLCYLDYYSFEDNRYIWGPGEETAFFWGAKFPASMLSENTNISSVSTYFFTEGQYSTYIYQNTGGVPTGKPIATVIDQNYPQGWNTISITSTELDAQKDLWVVFECTDVPYPLIMGAQNADNGNYYSFNGTQWGHLTGYAHFISAELSDGSFSYNIYDGVSKISSGLTTSSHILSNISSGSAHQYRVKAQKGENESDASNMIGFTRGSAAIDALSLDEEDMMTLLKNSTLTVSGALENDNPENLILEDGAQLINGSTGVKATVKKTIEGFQTDNNKGNWYLIASPISEQLNIADSTNLKATNATDYDLYAFNQASNLEWLNYKKDHFTTIDNKTGYLYAHRSDIDIEFAGTLNNTDGSVPITYTSDKPLAEYNLVGNPFPCNATIDKTDYYRIVETEEGSKIQLATTSTIAPMEGIFVKAVDGNDKTVTFSKETAKGNGNSGSMVNISVSRKTGNVLDNARIRLDGNLDMEKLILHDGGTRLYIPQSGIEYALVANNDLADVPMNFNAATDGIYTLEVEASNDIEHLHLIDNLTGADINLLATPSYSFEAKTDDYPSRFRILFNVIDENPSILDDVEGDIQIMDVTGRVISTDRNAKLTPGIYILRTVNGNDIQTKKIIIK